jgi:hypothetical protein
MTEVVNTKLFCIHCQEEAPHEIHYFDVALRSILCKRCGTEIKLDRKRILEVESLEFADRLFTKPRRLTEELRKDLTHLLATLPIRIATKPYRLAKEIVKRVK